MQHITALEDTIKYDPVEIQKKRVLLAEGKQLITGQLLQLQTTENYHSLNNIMLALQRAEKIIDILMLRHGH